MIPENKQAAVSKSLQKTFNVRSFDSIEQLTKGLSTALIFKIVVNGTPYLLRVITRTDAIADPTHYYSNMERASENGIGPAVYYMDTDDRISITAFIHEQPFSMAEARKILPGMLRKLHQLPKFDFRINYFHAVEKNFVEKFKASNIVNDTETKDMFELYNRIAEIYPRNDIANWVSCHNDLKADNILFDGQRAWFVDWESAFLCDPYMDMNMIANFVVKNDEQELEYLANYFASPVNEYQHARFIVMGQILHLYYFTCLMFLGATGKPVDVSVFNKPNFSKYHDELWKANINVANNDVKMQYAWEHRHAYIQKMNTSRLEDALKIIARH